MRIAYFEVSPPPPRTKDNLISAGSSALSKLNARCDTLGVVDYVQSCNLWRKRFKLPPFCSQPAIEISIGAATKYLKPLCATPLHWPVVAATATSATFSKSRNRYALLRYHDSPPPHPIKDSEREEAAGRRDSRHPPRLEVFGPIMIIFSPRNPQGAKGKNQLNFKGSVTAFLESY